MALNSCNDLFSLGVTELENYALLAGMSTCRDLRIYTRFPAAATSRWSTSWAGRGR
ncbi:uncharacterized protein METZ01_LOCUS503499, partial [marine metagenome]